MKIKLPGAGSEVQRCLVEQLPNPRSGLWNVLVQVLGGLPTARALQARLILCFGACTALTSSLLRSLGYQAAPKVVFVHILSCTHWAALHRCAIKKSNSILGLAIKRGRQVDIQLRQTAVGTQGAVGPC